MEIIEIVEKIVVVIKSRAKGSPATIKEIESKDAQFKTLKKRVHQATNALKDEQRKRENALLSLMEPEKVFAEILSWLPEQESFMVKQTPVSASYPVLKKQQQDLMVCFVVCLFPYLFGCFFCFYSL